ncbi:MAG: hypothetical protein V3T05_13530 [Myxococcota bacterium]
MLASRVILLAAAITLVWVAPAAAMSPKARRGKRVLKQAECNRCHTITDLSGKNRGVHAAERQLHCVDCHNWILDTKFDDEAIARQRRKFPDWDRYLENIVHFTELPDLGTLTRRVDPSFVRAFLDGPFDLRPHLDDSMVPVRLSSRDKDALVTYLTELNGDAVARLPSESKMPNADRIAHGKERFENLSCPTCHVVGNVKLDAKIDAAFLEAIKETAKGAPNLRFVRRRIPRDILVRYIQDPKSVDPKSRMPKQAVTREEAEAIADWLTDGNIEADGVARRRRRPRVPVLSRRVPYDEVFDQVLGKICVHCHMNRKNNGGEGGPGNSGGLGFAGVALDLETFRGIKKGLVRDGKQVSILKAEKPDQEPLLFESLLRRFDETSRDARNPDTRNRGPGNAHQDGRPGMPLALPPLTLEQLSLVKTWLEQGAPGPVGSKIALRRGRRGR